MSIERQCKCGSYAINDDPEGKKCDNCFGIAEERRKYAQVCAELAKARKALKEPSCEECSYVAELAHLRALCDREADRYKALKIELAAAKRHETYLWELCDRLAGYARHSGDCDKSYPAYSALKVKCSCGLDTLLTKDSDRGRGEG